MVSYSKHNNRQSSGQQDPVVITGIGLITALGLDREATWSNIRQGKCGIGPIKQRQGLHPNVKFAAEVNLPIDLVCPDELDVIRYSRCAFNEALEDSGVDLSSIDPCRIGVASNGHLGDLRQSWVDAGKLAAGQQIVPWWSQWLPQTATDLLANQHQFLGPRLCYATACASSMIAMIQSTRAIRTGQCDVMVAGGGQQLSSFLAAGFYKMRALSSACRPEVACRPFDQDRSGFVMGEGAAYVVLERLSHAVARGAKIYAEVLAGKMASQAHHITSVELEDEALVYLIKETIRAANLDSKDVEYINAHGTGTIQNDITEINCINSVFGAHTEQLQVSSTKSQIGHLVGASGSAELAVTLLGMRDGIAPPTANLENPEAACRFDCVAKQAAPRQFKHALKFSMSFGGHLAGIAVRRYDNAGNCFEYLPETKAA